MGNEFAGRSEHSADWFGDGREHWWNQDYVELLARRWRLAQARTLLDVGCGVGHWGQLLARHLPPSAEVTGVDREPAWVAGASERAARLELPVTFRYVQGEVERLPFAADSLDVVTCQTLLIHVRDREAALQEMLRVTRPGGLVVVAEPNNIASALVLDARAFRAPVEEIMALTRFQLLCERGKDALGEGHNSAGLLLPGLFARLGLEELQVSLNDRAGALIPPYASSAERAGADELLEAAQRELWNYRREDAVRFFRAGGGADAEFAPLWELALAQVRQSARSIADGTYEHAGGSLCYCIAGRKPRRATGASGAESSSARRSASAS